jgi:hypothetical protein
VTDGLEDESLKTSTKKSGTISLFTALTFLLVTAASFVGLDNSTLMKPPCMMSNNSREENTTFSVINSIVPNMNSNALSDGELGWQEVTPSVSPRARCGSPLVYDSKADCMVLFGGWQNPRCIGGELSDTWIYDLDTNTWTNMSPEVCPPGRGGHAMAYSERDDVIVMVGGGDFGGYANSETWVYNLNTNTWTNMSPASNPWSTAFASMVYDRVEDVFVLFGGYSGYPFYLLELYPRDETWIYDLHSNTWTNAECSTHPSGRYFAGMAYDYIENRVLLGGGLYDVFGGYFSTDIWEYKTTTNQWSLLTNFTEARPFAFTISFDIWANSIIVQGGLLNEIEGPYVQETWTYDLQSGEWNNTLSSPQPMARLGNYLAYDIQSGKTVMYGGTTLRSDSGEVLSDTWTLSLKATFVSSEDFDGDNLNNSIEFLIGTNPFNRDSDFDMIPDAWEYYNGTNPCINDANEDLDSDGLTNLEEYLYHTFPNNRDSDQDSFSDGWEVLYGFSPIDGNVPLMEYLIAYRVFEIIGVMEAIVLVSGVGYIQFRKKSNFNRQCQEQENDRKSAFDELCDDINGKDVAGYDERG